jgi:hypothetical protein
VHACRQDAVWLSACDGKTFLAIEPVDAINAGRLSNPPKQDEQPPITEALSFIGQVVLP